MTPHKSNRTSDGHGKLSVRRGFVGICLLALCLCSGCPPQSPTPKPGNTPPETSQSNQGPEATPLSAEQKAELAEQCNKGLAYLENLKFEEAINALESVLAMDAQNTFALQNASVAALMHLEELVAAGETAKTKSAAQTAQKFLSQWEELKTPSAVLEFLKARYLVATKADGQSIAAQYDQAFSLGKSASVAYEKFLALRRMPDPQAAAIADQALMAAFEVNSQNVQLHLDILQRSTEPKPLVLTEQIKASVLTALSKRIGFLAEGIQSRTRQNPLTLIENLQQLDQTNDKPQYMRNARILINIVRPESLVQSEKAEVAKNLLEYVQLSLPDELQQAIAESADSSIEMQWAAEVSHTWEPDEQPITAAAMGDFDLDGLNEVVLARGTQLLFYRHANLEEPWSLWSQLELEAPVEQILCLDLDNDFKENNIHSPEPQQGKTPPCRTATIDLVLRTPKGIVLVWNRGQGTDQVVQWEQKPLQDMLPESQQQPEELSQVQAFDFDADGDIDIVGTHQQGLSFWQQQSAQQFADVSSQSDLQIETAAIGMQLKSLDLDHDVDLDLILGVETAKTPVLHWCENLRHGEFRLRQLPLDSLPPESKTLLLAVEDFNADGHWDLLLQVSPPKGQKSVYEVSLRSTSPGQLQQVSVVEQEAALGSAVVVSDFDNNGACDLLSIEDGQLQLLRRDYGRQGAWIPGPPVALQWEEQPIVALLSCNENADANRDVMAVTHAGLSTLHNQSTLPNGNVSLTLLAQQVKTGGASASGRVNAYGYGSTVEVRSGAFYTRAVVDSPVMHIGLGPHAKADSVRVVWTNGIPDHSIDVAQGTYLCEKQELKGSCPYLYAWNGQEMAFVTDLLWAAPIGLIGPTGDLIPARPREELMILANQLQPLNGRYRLSITEELWEFAYFDQVELLVVDHPSEAVMATNEKVGPPAVAMPEWHLMTDRRPLRSATTAEGKDLRRDLARRDDRFAKPFADRVMQGLTTPSVMDLRFDPIRSGQRVRLVMTGWVFPTDTSINVQMSQSENHPKPEPPSLWIKDAQKQWQLHDPVLGFPGGKTKTVVYDITPYINPDDPHFQIRTSMELYWDEAYLSVGEGLRTYQTQRAPLVSASLRTRGYAQLKPHRYNGPELPDYSDVKTAQKWPSLSGMLTRLGDVTELLETNDDRLVVIGPGDEIQLQFEEPLQPVPEGWVREYVIVNTGWDKDADLNTIYGTTSEPLPFLRMTEYPPSAEEVELQQTERFDEYLQEYQTRPAR